MMGDFRGHMDDVNFGFGPDNFSGGNGNFNGVNTSQMPPGPALQQQQMPGNFIFVDSVAL